MKKDMLEREIQKGDILLMGTSKHPTFGFVFDVTEDRIITREVVIWKPTLNPNILVYKKCHIKKTERTIIFNEILDSKALGKEIRFAAERVNFTPRGNTQKDLSIEEKPEEFDLMAV